MAEPIVAASWLVPLLWGHSYIPGIPMVISFIARRKIWSAAQFNVLLLAASIAGAWAVIATLGPSWAGFGFASGNCLVIIGAVVLLWPVQPRF